MPASSEVVLSLAAATGATVQGALSTTGNCTIGGALLVQGTDVLALAQGKQSQLTSASQLHVDTIKALLYQCNGSEFYFWTSANVQLLKLSPTEATFNSEIRTPSVILNNVSLSTQLSNKQNAITTSTALSLSSVSASLGVTVTGGREGNPAKGAHLRLVSNGTLLAAPPALFFGVGGNDLHALEYNYLGFSDFYRTSDTTAWIETMRIIGGQWNFTQGIIAPSDSRLKDEVRDLPEEECLEVLRRSPPKAM